MEVNGSEWEGLNCKWNVVNSNEIIRKYECLIVRAYVNMSRLNNFFYIKRILSHITSSSRLLASISYTYLITKCLQQAHNFIPTESSQKKEDFSLYWVYICILLCMHSYIVMEWFKSYKISHCRHWSPSLLSFRLRICASSERENRL